MIRTALALLGAAAAALLGAAAVAVESAPDAVTVESAPDEPEEAAVPGGGDAPIRGPAWAVPPPGACEPAAGLRGWPSQRKAPPLPFEPGDVLVFAELPLLEPYLPEEVWAHRLRFFHTEMELEIGDCFADYGPPGFFTEATMKFEGRAQLMRNGGLVDYVAGLPFPPYTISPRDPDAGHMWAWNMEHRYQAAGFRGPFRMSDMVGETGRAEPFEGEIFKLNLSFRADIPEKYEDPAAKSRHWVAGGIFHTPFNARDYSWRQFRHVDHLQEPERSDDLHAYLPDWRRVRRMPSSNVEGIYVPAFSVGVQQPQTAVGAGAGSGGSSDGAIEQNETLKNTISTKRSGFEGLEIRPLLYDYRILGVRDVLTPINATTPAYPEEEDREFGAWGLSYASDRWDLRRALVLEGRLRGTVAEEGQVERVILYADLQTLVPLYYVSYRYRLQADAKHGLIDVGMYVGRWSEEREDYPRWPDKRGRAVRVIDPVGAAFANLAEGGGWRRESWTVVSTPPKKRKLRKLISVNQLSKRR